MIQFRSPWEGRPAIESGLPCVYEANGFPSIELRSQFENIPDSLIEKIRHEESRCLLGANRVVCHAEKTKEFLETATHLPTDKIRLIPNGYDPIKLLPKKSSHQLRLVYLGTLSSWQGVSWSLPVLKRLRPHVTLDIFCPTRRMHVKDLTRSIRKMKLQDLVTVRGSLPAYQRSLLSQFDFGFAPFLKDIRNSVQGACPIKLLDFKAAGLPILTSDLAISRPYVSEQIDGKFFHAGSRTQLQAALEVILHSRSRWDQWSQASLASLERFPTWEDSGAQLLKVHEELLCRN